MRSMRQILRDESVYGEGPRGVILRLWRMGRWVLAFALLVFLMSGGRQWLATTIEDGLCNLSNCHPTPGPSASWSTQVAAMQAALGERTQRPTRSLDVMAIPRSGSREAWDLDEAVEVTIKFDQPGRAITMVYLDTDPAGTMHVSDSAEAGGSDWPADSALLSDILAAIKVSPREAISRTWPQASECAQRAQLAVFPSVLFTKYANERSWKLYYLSKKEGADPLSTRFVCQYEVDMLTGEVTKAGYR
jgi:hypothetical protein